jgi:hypothetical protein
VRRHAREAGIVALAVLSHWILDWIVHRPDLPLWPGGPVVGLGLWNSWLASIIAELLVFGGGLFIYAKCTRAKDGVGKYAFWALTAFLVLGWISSLMAGPPPSVRALAWGGLTMWLMVPWGWWTDKHRIVSPMPSSS